MDLQLPKNQHRAFAEFSNLDQSAKEKLFALLRDEPPTLKVDDLALAFSQQTGVPRSSAGRIIWMLHNMYSARIQHALSAAEFAEAIVSGIGIIDTPELKIDAALLEITKHFLQQLLALDQTFGIVAKGLSIIVDQERTFTDSRILTDFRPVFGEDVETSPSAAVHIHQLRLTYSEDSETASFYVSLDTADLEALKATIDRALKKDVSLRKALAPNLICLS